MFEADNSFGKGNQMILADKIINERKKNGWSQEELADMLGVSRQSVSKWEGAQSIPDLQKILKMAEIFSVSTDYLLKDELEPENPVAIYNEENGSATALRRLSLEDASEYIELRKKYMPKIALGCFLCITCPVVLIFLAGLSDSTEFISETASVAIGLLWLFIQLAFALYIFITNSGKMKKFSFLEEEAFETEYGVDGMCKERLAAYESTYTRMITTGVLLCVLSVVPLIICSVLGFSSFVIICMVCLLLLCVGIAVFLFTAFCSINTSYRIILQEGDYAPLMKRKNSKLASVDKIYWLLITFIYLAFSFITQRWDVSWIIWAVSGVLFAIIRAIASVIVKAD